MGEMIADGPRPSQVRAAGAALAAAEADAEPPAVQLSGETAFQEAGPPFRRHPERVSHPISV